MKVAKSSLSYCINLHWVGFPSSPVPQPPNQHGFLTGMCLLCRLVYVDWYTLIMDDPRCICVLIIPRWLTLIPRDVLNWQWNISGFFYSEANWRIPSSHSSHHHPSIHRIIQPHDGQNLRCPIKKNAGWLSQYISMNAKDSVVLDYSSNRLPFDFPPRVMAEFINNHPTNSYHPPTIISNSSAASAVTIPEDHRSPVTSSFMTPFLSICIWGFPEIGVPPNHPF